MEPLSTEPYKGVRDFYPADWARLKKMFGKIQETLSSYGYEEYNASPLERAELYEAKTSEEIVNEQTYTFTDRGDRRVTLRPEMTPSLARMVAARRRELPLPLRWFSIGNRFRYERPQKGRLREFYQTDVDIIGLPEGEADIEIIRIVSDILKNFGAVPEDFTIRINSRTLLNAACRAAGLEGEKTRAYLRLLDKKAKMEPEAFAAAQEEIGGKDPLAIIEDPSDAPDVAAEKTRLLERIETLRAQGVSNIVFDTTVTRGFDYYTGMVFEVFDTDPANPRAMFGGGRYDNLLGLFGGDSLPAVGFGIGEVTLGEFLGSRGLLPLPSANPAELYLGTPSPDDAPAAQACAAALRNQGMRVFVNLTSRSLGDQIKDAVKRGIPYFAAYGSEERENGSVRVKTLSSGEEVTLTTSALVEHIRQGK